MNYTVREIRAEKVGADDQRQPLPWADLYKEMRLRLEMTTRAFALEVAFEDDYHAKLAMDAVRKHMVKDEKQGWIELSRRRNKLFVRRGKNYGQVSAPRKGVENE